MKSTLFTCAALAALVVGATSVHAGAPSQFSFHVTTATARGQAVIVSSNKKALALVAADSNFAALANKKIADTAAQLRLSNASQQMRTALNATKAALASKDSTLTVSDKNASAAALQRAYQSALTSNAVVGTAGNTIAYKSGDGSMQTASFVRSSATAAVVTAGTSETSLKGLSSFWKKSIEADTAALRGAYDIFYMTALSQVLSTDKIGCNAFNGYYSSDGASTPTFTKSGCAL